MLRVATRSIVLLISCQAIAWGQQSQPGTTNYLCPDDSSVDIASNGAGTSDKVVTVTLATGSDENFTLEVYSTTTGEVLDTVTITADTQPPITMPPGSKTRAKDPQDGDTKKPKGTVTSTGVP